MDYKKLGFTGNPEDQNQLIEKEVASYFRNIPENQHNIQPEQFGKEDFNIGWSTMGEGYEIVK